MRFALLSFALFAFVAHAAWASDSTPLLPDGSPDALLDSRAVPAVSTRGMVVADDREAAEWGAEVLRQGGNAVDAAVAAAFMMAVTRPQYASLGGGGFFVYCPAPGPEGPRGCETIDYREPAPAAATRDMYIKDGKPRTDWSQDGALAPGVPGVTGGLLKALERFGTLPRKKILSRPILTARKGFRISGLTEAYARMRWKALNPAARQVLSNGGLCREGSDPAPCAAGTTLKQPDLARVLEAISRDGKNGFYQGWVADKITLGLQRAGGILSPTDLSSYAPKIRAPLRGQFEGMEVVTMPPPSAGGAGLLQMLGYVERADHAGTLDQGDSSVRTLHVFAHAMALANADRAKFFGDPDQVTIPLGDLLSPRYLDARWKTFKRGDANLPEGPGDPALAHPPHESTETTHFSAIDAQGDAVSATTTVNGAFGSGFVPPGTGVFMNNEMDDFSIQPGVANQFGLVGAEANAIASHKRPASSMAPTIVRDTKGDVRFVLGASGGPRITTGVFLAIVRALRFHESLQDAVNAPRIHEQWRPKTLYVEKGAFGHEVREGLADLGYELQDMSHSCRIKGLERFANGRVWGALDMRTEGAAVAE